MGTVRTAPGSIGVRASTQASSTLRSAPLVIIVCRYVSASGVVRSTTTLSRLRMKSYGTSSTLAWAERPGHGKRRSASSIGFGKPDSKAALSCA